MDSIYSSSDAGGSFLSWNDDLNTGDSGGPAYADDWWMVGVVYDKGWNWAAARPTNTYTSVPRHLEWILNAMSYNIGAPFSWYDYRAKPFTASNHISSWSGLSKLRCKYA